jgi:hypothetical protein
LPRRSPMIVATKSALTTTSHSKLSRCSTMRIISERVQSPAVICPEGSSFDDRRYSRPDGFGHTTSWTLI